MRDGPCREGDLYTGGLVLQSPPPSGTVPTGSGTSMITDCAALCAVAVMLALPPDVAMATPDAPTLTTCGSELVQIT